MKKRDGGVSYHAGHNVLLSTSIGMVLGAAWNGTRAFTATSGPGLSLMQEFLGLAYYAEVPAVVFNIQRVGPSTGMPTRTESPDAGGLDEILVTAQRRSENLERTPVAVSVLSGDTLDKQEITTETDLRTTAPGLSVRSTSNSNQLNYVIRGQSLDALINL